MRTGFMRVEASAAVLPLSGGCDALAGTWINAPPQAADFSTGRLASRHAAVPPASVSTLA